MKVCVKCKIEKPFSEFNKNKSKKDGFGTECRDCIKEYQLGYRKENKVVLLQSSRDFKEANRSKINEKNRKRYLTKKLDNTFMEKKRISNSLWKRKNKGRVNADTAKRHTVRLQRSSLTTKEEIVLIRDIYNEAQRLTKETGTSYHVDHIIPLQGKFVSGLHISSNLQILTEQENCSKHNSFIV